MPKCEHNQWVRVVRFPTWLVWMRTVEERVLIEVKFQADLQPTQPNGYLNRLPVNGPAILMFLVPEDRVKSLWDRLRTRINGAGQTLQEVDSERKCMRLGETERHLMVVSWPGLLIAWQLEQGTPMNKMLKPIFANYGDSQNMLNQQHSVPSVVTMKIRTRTQKPSSATVSCACWLTGYRPSSERRLVK